VGGQISRLSGAGCTVTADHPQLLTIKPFESLEEARDSFERLCHVYIQSRPSGGSEHDPFQESYDYFEANFNAFIAMNQDTFEPRDHRTVALLELHKRHLKTSMMVAVNDRFDVMAFDQHQNLFEEMVDFAEQVIKPIDESEEHDGPKFQPDIGIVTPLFATIQRCRDPNLRRRATQLLKQSGRQEGVWNSDLMGRLAEKLIEFEESLAGTDHVQSCQDVPSFARITHWSGEPDPVDKCAAVGYGNSSKSCIELLEWK
jgi:hypothetical protein